MRMDRVFSLQMGRVCALFLSVVSAIAQNAPTQTAGTSIGGKWVESQAEEEKMTGKQRIRFELEADNFLSGAEARPKVILFCVGGKLKLGDFRPNVRIAPPNRASFVGRPQLKVTVRVGNSHYNKNWNWVNGDFLAMDEDTVRKLIGSTVFKIQFTTREGPQIAEFSPAGLDLAKVKRDCKLKPEKP